MAKLRSALALAFLLLAAPVRADEIVAPAPGLARDRTYEFFYRIDRPLTGTGALAIEWTDALGRVVERRSQAVTLTRGESIGFTVDLRRAVAMKNRLRARLTIDAVGGPLPRYEGRAEASFIATPPEDPWRDYQVIMWQDRTAGQYAALKSIGISAGMVTANRIDPGAELATPVVEALLDADLRWYVENIATDFYAAYHRWTPDRPVNFQYLEAKRRHRENPDDLGPLMREPSLVDPAWLSRVAERLKTVTRLHAPYAPLYYSLGDEPGIADLSANWDFDFGTGSLAEMRTWLRVRYGTLDALNRQWGARFATWDAVVPPTTTQAMRRKDQNYSAWSDFKEWMDESFARAVRHGADAVHAADPAARAAIEGMQVPGWGGYDYARLAPVVDVMDIYDVGGNTDIVRSLHPGAIRLVTSFGASLAGDRHRLWRQWLRGGRGVILWDEESSFVDDAGMPGPRGRAHDAQFREMRSGLGALVINSVPRTDRIAVLYSPPSIRARWMLDYRALGDGWIARDAEREHNDVTAYRAAMTGFIAAVRGAGFQPRLVSEQQLERDLEGDAAPRLLILPHALALSEAAAARVRRFAESGGIVVADIVPGAFDRHVRRRAKPILSDLFTAGRSSQAVLLDPTSKAVATSGLRGLAARAGLAPVITVLDRAGAPVGDVETYVYRQGDALLLGLIRDQAPARDAPEPPRDLRVKLEGSYHVRDLRAGHDFGRVDKVDIALDSVAPTILALTSTPPTDPVIESPPRARAGETMTISIQLASPAAVARFEVIDPAGHIVPQYGGNLLAQSGRIAKSIPFAVNDQPGAWQVRATDILGGGGATARIDVLLP